VDGTLAELVAAIPYLLVFGRIPPRRVLDTIFRAGIVDAGMSGGCRWAPFEIGDAEYEELATALVGAGHRRVDCPDWVESPGDWTVWLLGEVRGVSRRTGSWPPRRPGEPGNWRRPGRAATRPRSSSSTSRTWRPASGSPTS
jgi:hypothetical protein